MAKNGIAKCSGDSRAEPNSILRVVLIEAAVRKYLEDQPGTLFLLERRCDTAESEQPRALRRGLEHSEGLYSLAAS
jgi:hypothetical protein